VIWMKVEPAFDRIRDELRFQALIRRLNLGVE